VPATATYSPTGDPYIDGVLGDTVITLDADNTLTLTNVMVSALHHDDFSFT
jgi:hypothetical protein